MADKTRLIVEGGDPAADPKAFRRALGSFPTGVSIITTPGLDAPAGVTANSFASVSLDPPLVLWSIAHTSRSHAAFRQSAHFAINILADDQVGVSQAFASASYDKFSLVDWHRGGTGSPLIDNALAYFDCVCEARHEGGDHTIMIGRVIEFGRSEGSPLAFSQGRYGITLDHPEVAAKARDRKFEEPGLDELPFLSLIAKAHYKEDADLEEWRSATGYTQVGSKVLAGLYQSAPLTADELARRMYLDRREVDDSLNEFLADGHVAIFDGHRFALTESGKQRRRQMIEYLSRYQDEQLADINPADLIVATRVLKAFLTGPHQGKPDLHI
ncbi:flavin reductase [Mesorhizobium sp. BE184]|uniref:flavin reductase n=1 Tax=Mesorhizobium sp. BE184 TaxID=2817714 RepID=UPI00285E6A54|nr:flavin reductase [Mesorhizobium sp. BE184]MDR7031322.1 flavin reductase (DIM6/NTAB) family NADH-FMN oxidoreductase RutF/DNA-binding MarR family transcriptional regulator [Mesorhizobium sp. BE184]